MAGKTNLEQAEAFAWEMIRRLAPLVSADTVTEDLDELESDVGLLTTATENLLLIRKLRVLRKLAEDA